MRLAGALALTAGAITPAAGPVGLGFLSDRISLPIRLLLSARHRDVGRVDSVVD